MKQLLPLLALLAALGARGATARPAALRDTTLLAEAERAARQRYFVRPPVSRLLNGVAYTSTRPSYVTGQPFFRSSEPQPGSLVYDGQAFPHVQLLYEQVLDQVLLYGPEQAAPLQLIRQKVQSFELAGAHFVQLSADSAGLLVAGFYDLAVDGPAQLLVRRAKKLAAATGGYGLQGEYEEKTQFFAYQRGRYYEVGNLQQVLAALADKKLELQAYARSNRLRFSASQREASLVALFRQYNALAAP